MGRWYKGTLVKGDVTVQCYVHFSTCIHSIASTHTHMYTTHIRTGNTHYMTPISEWMAYFDGWFGILLVGVGSDTFGMVQVT